MDWKLRMSQLNDALAAGNHAKVRRMYKELIGEIVNCDEALKKLAAQALACKYRAAAYKAHHTMKKRKLNRKLSVYKIKGI